LALVYQNISSRSEEVPDKLRFLLYLGSSLHTFYYMLDFLRPTFYCQYTVENKSQKLRILIKPTKLYDEFHSNSFRHITLSITSLTEMQWETETDIYVSCYYPV